MRFEPEGFASVEVPSNVLRALADETRRELLAVACETDGPESLSELAGELAARECVGVDPADGRVEELMISLHHVHLPSLDDCGLLEYDVERRLVRTTEAAREAREAAAVLTA